YFRPPITSSIVAGWRTCRAGSIGACLSMSDGVGCDADAPAPMTTNARAGIHQPIEGTIPSLERASALRALRSLRLRPARIDGVGETFTSSRGGPIAGDNGEGPSLDQINVRSLHGRHAADGPP